MKQLYTMLCLAACSLSASAQLTLDTPQAKPATSITSSGFTANWGAVANAEAYCVFVYAPREVTTDGEQTIVDEDFSGITSGTISNPSGGSEEWVDLSAYGYTTTYGWGAYAYPTFISSMVAGLIYSPYLDLRGNDGQYTITVTAYCSNGDEIRVESNGKNGKEIQTAKAVVPGGATGLAELTFDFDNGSKDLFFTVINNTAADGAPDYFDRIRVAQDLKKGDMINDMVASNEAVLAVDEYTNDSITSCRFTTPSRYTSAKVLYYDLYAATMDYDTPNGSLPYTYVQSNFSKRVKVDLTQRTSEVEGDTPTLIKPTTTATTEALDGVWFTLSGQRTTKPSHGVYIHNGKKTVIK